MKHGSLFSGIGGFDLAAQWMHWENVFHCEKDPFCLQVLNYYWPAAKSFTDITKSNFKNYANKIDILTGGFPCQPYSIAGKRKGSSDPRHLWPEMLRAVREIKPRWIVAENVPGLVNWGSGLVFEQILADLEHLGYETQPFIIPAAGINAPHKRARIWIIAYANRAKHKQSAPELNITEGGQTFNIIDRAGKKWIITNPNSKRQEKQNTPAITKGKGFNNRGNSKFGKTNWEKFPIQYPVFNRNDGVPVELDSIAFPEWSGEVISAAGNAIVPHVALAIFEAINSFETIVQKIKI